jgi:hypothetical protein
METNGARPPACPASISHHEVGPEVVLHLDPAPLGLTAAAFDTVPDLDRAIWRLLPVLDRLAPAPTGMDPGARAQLARAQELYETVDADYERGPGAWQPVEQMFLEAASQMEQASDPLLSAAWTGVARSRRYQKGRRDERLEAAVTAIYWDRASVPAWAELVEAAGTAPHVPTLLELFRRIPIDTRPKVLSQLITLSRGHDRLGNMRPAAGGQLRAGLAQIAEADNDKPSVTKLVRDARRHA